MFFFLTTQTVAEVDILADKCMNKFSLKFYLKTLSTVLPKVCPTGNREQQIRVHKSKELHVEINGKLKISMKKSYLLEPIWFQRKPLLIIRNTDSA
jgi:hypothetical protein